MTVRYQLGSYALCGDAFELELVNVTASYVQQSTGMMIPELMMQNLLHQTVARPVRVSFSCCFELDPIHSSDGRGS